MLPNVSLGTPKHSDYEPHRITPSYEYSTFDVKRQRPLSLKRKIQEFYTAPITKFLANSVSIPKTVQFMQCFLRFSLYSL